MEDKITFYRLRMETQNPSANRTGHFKTLKDAEDCKKYWENIVKKDGDSKDYYGDVEFYITDEVMYFGKEYFE